jgi:hypothetical protein
LKKKVVVYGEMIINMPKLDLKGDEVILLNNKQEKSMAKNKYLAHIFPL